MMLGWIVEPGCRTVDLYSKSTALSCPNVPAKLDWIGGHEMIKIPQHWEYQGYNGVAFVSRGSKEAAGGVFAVPDIRQPATDGGVVKTTRNTEGKGGFTAGRLTGTGVSSKIQDRGCRYCR